MTKRSACLVDTTRCIGCRSCQVACKQSNQLKSDKTRFFAVEGGYQNPPRFSPRTFTYIAYHEAVNEAGDPAWVFIKRQCMHCGDLYCQRVCPAEVFGKTESGIVAYQADRCIGCGQCIDACPFHVPTIDYWDLPTPHLRKCSFCQGRQEGRIERAQVDGTELSGPALDVHRESFQKPACSKACPTGAIQFGDREELLAEAARRIAAEPDKYIDHIYGETEAGGTGWLYLAGVPFEELGLPAQFLDLKLFQKTDVGAASLPLPSPASNAEKPAKA